MKFEVPTLHQTRVLVVGDVMLDRYWHGNTDRISPEAPVPVVHVAECEERPGGAGNVALNIQALGAQAILIGVCGLDEAGNILEAKLKAVGIDCYLQRIVDRPTITKLRILSLHQQLIRLDFEQNFKDIDTSPLLEACLDKIPEVDVVILSDYGKGSLGFRQAIIAGANQANIPILVDPKGKDFSLYQNATILTPNRKEFEAVVGPCVTEEEFVSKGLALIRECRFKALLVTRGSQGMTLLRQGEPELHLPAKAREVYDVTGAGDTVIAVLATTLGGGADLPIATALANCAAGIAVGKLGAATVSLPELRRAMVQEMNIGTGVMNEEQLLVAVSDAKAHGERIVMTNGCFDILHAGHVAYLEQAKALGDRLIVALNDDASVAGLKGVNRPINSLERRMAVIAGLASVDWVVPFSEPTPERLISQIIPHILVKGGDYKVEEVAGGQHVIEQGGEVVILDFLPGCSTSSIVKRIKEEEVIIA